MNTMIIFWIPLSGSQDAVSGHVESLSRSVIKNLTLHRVKQIILLKKDEIRSFLAMYNTWGCSFGRNGPKNYFLQRTGSSRPKEIGRLICFFDFIAWFLIVCDNIYQIMHISLFPIPFESFHFHGSFLCVIHKHISKDFISWHVNSSLLLFLFFPFLNCHWASTPSTSGRWCEQHALRPTGS